MAYLNKDFLGIYKKSDPLIQEIELSDTQLPITN